jgi:hypothetical protein
MHPSNSRKQEFGKATHFPAPVLDTLIGSMGPKNLASYPSASTQENNTIAVEAQGERFGM